MASMLEGGGKTPILPKQTLQMMGFKLVAYPLSLLGVSVRAMQLALKDLADDRCSGLLLLSVNEAVNKCGNRNSTVTLKMGMFIL